MIAEIENLRNQNDTRKFYQAVNNAKKGFQPRTSMCRKKNGDLVCDLNGILERWKEHFDDLLNATAEAEERPTARRKPYEQEDGKEFSTASRSEVAAAIKQLKNNKAPGDDSLPGELFKAGGEKLVETMFGLIVRIWSEEKLPKEWKTSVICPLHKKGCKLDCGNYRGISLLPTAYKVLSSVYQVGGTSRAFRRGLPTPLPGRIQKRNIGDRPNLLPTSNCPEKL